MHILERRAKASALRSNSAPRDGIYDFAAGVWRGPSGLLAYDPAIDQMSKKNDLETGEDQKGQ